MTTETEREYWLAGGADKEKVEAFIAERNAASDAMEELAQTYGGSAVSRGPYLAGLLFPDDRCPDNWTKRGEVWDDDKSKHRSFYMPKRTSKALRAISDALSAPRAKVPGAREFHGLIAQSGGVVTASPGARGMRILYAGWESIGDDLVLSIPLNDGKSIFTPDGSRKLAMSEYWAMKEQASTREQVSA